MFTRPLDLTGLLGALEHAHDPRRVLEQPKDQ
jgi:hypothetical protein